MYLVRNSFTAEHGQAPSIVDILKGVNESLMEVDGFSNGKIYVDVTGQMDTVIWQIESQSLDQFLQVERDLFINPDPSTQHLIDTLNRHTAAGKREIFEMI